MKFINIQSLTKELDVQPNMRIADFGCGSGDIAILLAQQMQNTGIIFAIDILESALSVVKSKMQANNLRNIQTLRANLEQIGSSGIKPETIDLVLLVNILFQSTNKQAIINEALRVLHKDGQMLVVDWAQDSGQLGPASEHKIDLRELKEMIIASGFTFKKDLPSELVGQYHFGVIFIK